MHGMAILSYLEWEDRLQLIKQFVTPLFYNYEFRPVAHSMVSNSIHDKAMNVLTAFAYQNNIQRHYIDSCSMVNILGPCLQIKQWLSNKKASSCAAMALAALHSMDGRVKITNWTHTLESKLYLPLFFCYL